MSISRRRLRDLPVSRVEIAEQFATAFMGPPVTREQLLAFARQGGARPAVLQQLEQLPDGPFREVRELWPSMPDLPIERAEPRRITDVC
jgi:hypothetical protein